MKKTVAYAVSLAMAASFSVAAPTAVAAASAKEDVAGCKEFAEGIGLSQGECMAILRSSDVSSQCKLYAWIADYYGLPFLFPFKNHGECVKAGGPPF